MYLPQNTNDNAKIFIAGANIDRRSTGKGLVTNGGRVLAASAYGNTADEAWELAYDIMKQIRFDGMFYRKDIGLPGAAESGQL